MADTVPLVYWPRSNLDTGTATLKISSIFTADIGPLQSQHSTVNIASTSK